MKSILSLILVLCCNWLYGQITYDQVYVDYDSAWQFQNLKLIPVRSKGPGSLPIMSLSQAIRNGSVIVSERGTASIENVHWLRINNNSKIPLFISSGEMVIGGRQDRIISKDTVLVPTGGDQYVPAMCVEEGRWSEKEKKFQHGGFINPSLRKVVDQSKNQLLIWKEIYNQLEASSLRSPTLAYASLRNDKKISAEVKPYYQFMMDHIRNTDSNMVGIICISGNKVLGTDIFAAGNIFYDEVGSLLPGYIESAITTGSVPALADRDVREFTDKILMDESLQEEYCKKNGKLFRYNGVVFHLTAF